MGNKCQPLGTAQILEKLVLKHFDQAMKMNNLSTFKTTIIFTNSVMASDLQDYLICKYPGIPEEQRPWVVNHSKKEEIDKEDIFNRTAVDHPQRIRLIITTTCMLMGINVPKADIVINLGCMANLSDGVQALGRVGRRDGSTDKVRPIGIMYNLLNSTDMAHHTAQSVKEFMNSDTCLTAYLEHHFGWNETSVANCMRCSNCF